jgi:DNA ligase D-like protein (predicted 3'-phosphoesterase)
MDATSRYSLSEYAKKRDFTVTPEPDDSSGRPEHFGEEPIFVIQKHDASRLHYDLRLEWDSVLKSWAIPKGPSRDPAEKRLAIPTEDHPLQYAEFEGVIPEDEYGGGTVMVWDIGSYRNLKKEEGLTVGKAVEDGHITFWLTGGKLKGGFALTRTGSQGNRESWLLVKMRDEHAVEPDDVLRSQPHSVLTGRSLEEITEDEESKTAP